MKIKKIVYGMLTGVAMLGLVACGKETETESNTSNPITEQQIADVVPVHLMKVEEIVTLGDYKNIELNTPKASQEEIDYYADYYFNQLCSEEFAIKDRAVELGDTINLDYSGTKVGETEPFQGGTAQDQSLGIGSGQFIPGFEEQLIGVMPGETVDVKLSFPEDYHAEELAGAPVVFTCTVNYIIPKMNDEAIKGFSIQGVEDVASFKDYIASMMNDYYSVDAEELLIEALLEQTTFGEIPSDMIAKREAQIREELTSYAAQAGTTPEDYVASNYSMGLEDFIKDQADQVTRIYLACQAIANREGLGVTDAVLEETLQTYATSNGYDDLDKFLVEAMGGVGRDDFREQIMFTNVMEYLSDVVKNK